MWVRSFGIQVEEWKMPSFVLEPHGYMLFGGSEYQGNQVVLYPDTEVTFRAKIGKDAEYSETANIVFAIRFHYGGEIVAIARPIEITEEGQVVEFTAKMPPSDGYDNTRQLDAVCTIWSGDIGASEVQGTTNWIPCGHYTKQPFPVLRQPFGTLSKFTRNCLNIGIIDSCPPVCYGAIGNESPIPYTNVWYACGVSETREFFKNWPDMMNRVSNDLCVIDEGYTLNPAEEIAFQVKLLPKKEATYYATFLYGQEIDGNYITWGQRTWIIETEVPVIHALEDAGSGIETYVKYGLIALGAIVVLQVVSAAQSIVPSSKK